MTVMEYDAATHEEQVARWWNRRHPDRVFQPGMLPPVGLVAVDETGPCFALWMHLSAGVGVAFLENPVSRPRQALAKSKEAFLMLLAAMEKIATAHDYGVIICHAPEVTARVMRKQGYDFHTKLMLTGSKLLKNSCKRPD